VKGKLFARIRNHDDLTSLVLWTGEKDALLADDRGIFFTTPHYDGHPMLLIRLPKITERELREMLTESWRLRAPAKVRKDNPEV
jgi:hypothetical protein